MKKIIILICFTNCMILSYSQTFKCEKFTSKLNGSILNEIPLLENSNIQISQNEIIISTQSKPENPVKTKNWKVLKFIEFNNSNNGKLDLNDEILVEDNDHEKWKGYLYVLGSDKYFILENIGFPSAIWYTLKSDIEFSKLVSKWEKPRYKSNDDSYQLEVYLSNNNYTATMYLNNNPTNYFLTIDKYDKYTFYNTYNNTIAMTAELKIIKGQRKLFFNGGNLNMIQVND